MAGSSASCQRENRRNFPARLAFSETVPAAGQRERHERKHEWRIRAGLFLHSAAALFCRPFFVFVQPLSLSLCPTFVRSVILSCAAQLFLYLVRIARTAAKGTCSTQECRCAWLSMCTAWWCECGAKKRLQQRWRVAGRKEGRLREGGWRRDTVERTG